MSRYIDVDLAIEEIIKDMCGVPDIDEGLSTAISELRLMPTVEIVHCEHCMFNHWHKTPNGEKYHICNLNKLSFSEHADFYCAYGERREDDKG